ncbi:MAG: GMC family oxidoreductase [Moraxellaceae bacterium]|nr:GMC family oxidoreductase [Moraxellaceae bacterium]
MGEKIAAASGLAVTQAADVAQAQLTLTADVVVVGSGAGGAVAAYELARAGKSVIVLEAGPYVPSSEFTEDFAKAMEQLYQDKGAQANKDGDLLVLQGRCVGGSTVVNGCVSFRTPDYILEDWQRDYGLGNLTPAALEPYFAKVEERLGIHSNEEYEINRNSSVIREGCKKLGISWKPFQRNIRECALTGHCLSGCASDRKQSMLVTYLPWAVALGAKIYADTHVTQVLAENGKTTGVRAEIIDPKTGTKKADVTVNAKAVVLAAGAVQTPLLLQKSAIANSSGQVGKNFACHPSLMVVAEYEEDVHPWRGALLGVYVDEWAHPSKGGFILEAGGAGPVELSAVANPGVGQPFMDYMANLKKHAGMVTLIHDHNVGEIRWDADKKRIDYQIADSDFPAMIASIKAAARVHFAGGAKKVYVPTVAQRVIQCVDDIDAVVDSIEPGPQTFRMVSYHPQGTCRMGADAKTAVVNPDGECHDVKNLFITDASLFPTSIIVNPQVTVYALASYISDRIMANAERVFA